MQEKRLFSPNPRMITASAGFATGAVLAAVLLIVLGLFACAIFSTTVMSMTEVSLETVTYSVDHPILSLLGLALGVALLGLMYRLSTYLPERAIPIVLLVYTVLAGTIWVLCAQSAPNHDSGVVTFAGYEMANGITTTIERDYFHYYPFQLGYVAWSEFWCALLVRIPNFQPLQIVNVLCLGLGAVSLWGISDKLFADARGKRLVMLLYLAFPQAIWFCTFLYGNLPSFGFAAGAVWMLLCYFEEEKPWQVILSTVLILLAIWLKLNSLIVFVAMGICFFLHLLQEKKWRMLPFFAAMLLLVPLGKNLPVTFYEARTGLTFGEGIPMVSWAHMGLSTAHGDRPGWYNGSLTRGVFDHFGMDPEQTAAYSVTCIKSILSDFAAHPDEAVSFFGRKIASQWNETTFQSIWNNQVRANYGDRVLIAKTVCDDAPAVFTALCDIGHGVSLFGAVIGLCALLRRRRARDMLPALIFLGGFLYHMIFEAKSQYVLTYMLWMIPIAAQGYSLLFAWVRRKIGSK